MSIRRSEKSSVGGVYGISRTATAVNKIVARRENGNQKAWIAHSSEQRNSITMATAET